eukprot:4269458-Pyramimonas_sp.AAC.1
MSGDRFTAEGTVRRRRSGGASGYSSQGTLPSAGAQGRQYPMGRTSLLAEAQVSPCPAVN